MKKRLASVLVLTAAFMLPALLGGCGSQNELTIDKVDVVADVLPDGDLYVEELYTYAVRGEYSSISRYMDNFGDSNIEFFEAYVPPNDRELGQFGYENLERHPVALSAKRGSYYVDVQAKDEVIPIYYRYRLDQEAIKYSDGGKLDWIVFDENETDHQNVTVTIRMRQHAEEPLVGYAFDRSGGAIIEETNRLVRYENKLLPEQDSLRLKVFFPAGAVPDMEAVASSEPLTERLADEEALLQRFAERERLLEAGRQVSRWLTYAAAAGILFYALSLRKLSAWRRGRSVAFGELEEMDPVRLVYLYRRGKLRRSDVLASVFALRRRGMIDMTVIQAGARFQGDSKAPKQLPQFAFRGVRTGLKASERYVLSWLFRGTAVMNLENISGPTKTERKQKNLMGPYMKRLRGFKRGFSRWRGLVEDEEGRRVKFQEYPPRKIIVPALAFTHFILLIYLYIADAVPWKWVALLVLILGGGVVWASIRRHRMRYISAYLVACFFVAAQIVHDPVVEEYLNFVILSFLLVALLPGKVTDPVAESYRSAIKRYRRMLANGGADEGSAPDRLERMMESALLLGVGRRFLTRARKRQPASSFYLASPLLNPDALAAIDYAFIRSWEGIAGKSASGASGGGVDGGSSYGDSGDSGSDGGGDGGGGGGD